MCLDVAYPHFGEGVEVTRVSSFTITGQKRHESGTFLLRVSLNLQQTSSHKQKTLPVLVTEKTTGKAPSGEA